MLDLLGGDEPRTLVSHGAEFQLQYRQDPQPIVAEHAKIELPSLDILLGDGGSADPLVDEGDALCELLVCLDDGCLRDTRGSILVQAFDDQRQRKTRRPPTLRRIGNTAKAGTAIRRCCTNVFDRSLPRARIRPRGLHPV